MKIKKLTSGVDFILNYKMLVMVKFWKEGLISLFLISYGICLDGHRASGAPCI